LEKCITWLEKKFRAAEFDDKLTKEQLKIKRGPGPVQGTTGLLLQIMVLDQLALVFANGSPISKTSELEKQVDFLVSVLRGATTYFSQQQFIDLKQLLAMISAHIAATRFVKPLEYFQWHGKGIAMDMSLPLQQLKTHWQMCMTCGELMFGVKADNTKCCHEGCDDLLKKPVLGIP
jgi:hypothetical protein